MLADASEITGLPRDSFEVREITREEFREVPARHYHRTMTKVDTAKYWELVPPKE